MTWHPRLANKPMIRLHLARPCAVALYTQTVPSHNDRRRDEARLRLLRFISKHPDASTHQIATAIGVSNGAAFYLTKALLERDLLKARNFTSSQRKTQYLYVLTPKGVRQKFHLTREFLTIKREEYQALESEIQDLERDLKSVNEKNMLRQ